MEIFIGVVIVLGYLVLLCWLMARAIDYDSLFNRCSYAAFILAAVGCTVLVYAAASEESTGPCLHYETQMYWNASTKSMMPARVCTLRAEWVEE